MRRPLSIAFSVLATAALFAGCASTGALTSARASFERAKASGAESKTPFEYYAAEAYLQRAEHEASEGDGKEAKVFASESEKYSAQAIEKAGGGAK